MRHVLDRIAVHYAWDRGLPAALRIASGDEVSFSVGAPASAPAPQRHKYEGEKTTGPMPLSGPVWVEGAKPSWSDPLKVVQICYESLAHFAPSKGGQNEP